jgi:hypothetical protein
VAPALVRAREAGTLLGWSVITPATDGTATDGTATDRTTDDASRVRTGMRRKDAALLTAANATHEMRPNQVACEHFGGYVDVLDGKAAAGIARISFALNPI